MEEAKTMFSASSLLTIYATFCTFFMFLQNAYHELVPYQLKSYLLLKLGHYFSWKNPQTSHVTLIIDDSWGGYNRNKLIKAASTYLSTKIGPKNKKVRIGMFKKTQKLMFSLVDGEEVVDIFDGINITWKLVREDQNDDFNDFPEPEKHFEVRFEEKYRDKVVSEYFDHVHNTYEEMKEEEKGLKIYSLVDEFWESVEFNHPAIFRTLAMNCELKKAVMNDLDRFLSRKEYYKRVGKAWKRCYLLFGPPGVGKSSLVAAMANYLRFDIYELELSNVFCEFDLRRLLLEIEGNCILVIEDIDCNSRLSGTESESNEKEPKDEDDEGEERSSQIETQKLRLILHLKFQNGKKNQRSPTAARRNCCVLELQTQTQIPESVSALKSRELNSELQSFLTSHVVQISAADVLRCIEGLWAKCEEQRIVVLTTNHKEALEAELDVPGLIDMNIHMSYCTVQDFRILALNYLGIEEHPLFEEIDELIRTSEVTSASLAEELLKNDGADNALSQVIYFLKQKKIENRSIY